MNRLFISRLSKILDSEDSKLKFIFVTDIKDKGHKEYNGFKIYGDTFNKTYDDKRDIKLIIYYLTKELGGIIKLSSSIDVNNSSEELEIDKDSNQIEIIYNNKVKIAIGDFDSNERTISNICIYDSLRKNYIGEKESILIKEGDLGKKECSDFFEDELSKYNDNLFELYVRHLLKQIKYYKQKNISGKMSALITYESLKEYINSNYDLSKNVMISTPNCFIEDYRQEFDALLLVPKKNYYKDDQYFYKKEDVIAVLELKTSGVMNPIKNKDGRLNSERFKKEFSKDIIYRYFKNLIYEKNELDKFNSALDKNSFIIKNINGYDKLKPFIYITFHEEANRYKFTKEAFDEYNDNKDKNMPKCYYLFVTQKNGSDKYIYPEVELLNLTEIVEDIKKESKKVI